MKVLTAFLAVAFLVVTNPAASAQPSDAADISFWQSVENAKDPAELEAYLKAFPNGKFAPLARIRLNRLKSGAAPPPAQPSPAPAATADAKAVHECDRLVANPFDPQRVSAGLPPDKVESERAIAACRQAIAQQPDNPRFQYQLGRALEVAKNYAESLEWTHKAAAQKYPMALGSLGRVHHFGIGVVSKDLHKAADYFRQAAELGHAFAMTAFGQVIFELKDERRYGEAVEWYRKAAALGSAHALTGLGYVYANGFGVARDYSEAVKYFRQGVEKRDFWSMYHLARMQMYGQGVPRDLGEARKNLQMAAQAGHVPSMRSLGFALMNGSLGRNDYVEAMRWLRLASEKGDGEAAATVGFLYDRGLGVAQDFGEAVRWARIAADRNNAAGLYNLGLAYQTGRGVAKDESEAARLYRKASNASGNASANADYNLSLMYLNGTGVARDPVESTRLMRKAADAGHTMAQVAYGVRAEQGVGMATDLPEAIRRYRKAAEGGNFQAHFQLARVYERGIHVAKDPELGASHLFEAVKARAATGAAGDNSWMAQLKVSAEFMRAFQRKLKDAGHYRGALDGKLSPVVREAVDRLSAEFKKRHLGAADTGKKDFGVDTGTDFGSLN